MKKYLLSFVFITSLMFSNLFAQAEITSRLSDALAEASKNNTPVRALVVLNDHVDIRTLDRQLYDTKATLEERAYTVIKTLQAKANQTQGSLLSFLESKDKSQVIAFEGFWITNMISIEAVPSIIIDLANNSDIGYMDLDAELEWDKPVSSAPAASKSPNGHEIGLERINAHLMWAAGFTGAGRIVMNDDTGVDVNHPALGYKWRGNQPGVPASAAWYDPGGSTTPYDADDHGTHTMGTMCGLEPATNDTVGVAPGAQWIASRGGYYAGGSIAAWQWAMDPDSNPATIDDMPDAINNSWYDPSVTNDCDPVLNPYYNPYIAVEASGIAIIFSAGNSGPAAQTIAPPKNANIDEVSFWATGALDGNNPSLPIASFSSRGPVSVACSTGISSLDIKPEASAPGVDVRSVRPLSMGGGYQTMSGTSMAAPHVAGAIALLREAHPGITGKEAKYALYSTAVDLGVPGEDNTYGMGIIDVWAANLSLVDPADPVMVVTPTAVYDTLVVGATGTDNVTVYNNRILPSSLNYTVTESPVVAWVDVNPSSGIIPTNDNDVLDLNFNATAVTPGSYSTELIIAGDDPNNTEDTVNVYLEVLEAPTIGIDPTSFTKSLLAGQVEVDTLTISNTGLGILEFDISIESSKMDASFRILKNFTKQTERKVLSKVYSFNELSLEHAPQTQMNTETNNSKGTLKWAGEAFGADIDNSQFLNFSLLDPTNTSVVGTFTQSLYAGDMGPDGVFYTIDNDLSTLVTIDTSTGALTTVGTMAITGGHTWTGLTYDPSNATWYALSVDGISAVLYTVDISTGTTTVVGSQSDTPFGIDLTVDNAGIMYTHDISIDAIYTMDKSTAAATMVGATGISCNYAQGMDIDPATNTLYLAAYTTLAELYEVDVTTGAATFIGTIGTGGEMGGFGVAGAGGGNWLSIAPNAGTVSPAGSIDIEVTFDAAGMLGGDYSANILVNSNDPANPVVTVTADLHVTGAPDVAVYPDTLDYGSIFTVESDTLAFTVENTGTDVLMVTGMTKSTGEFSILGSTPFSLNIGETVDVDVVFASTTPGTFTDMVTITSDGSSGDQYVDLVGSTVYPPVTTIYPDTFDVSLLTGGTHTTDTLVIKNEGLGELTFDVFTATAKQKSSSVKNIKAKPENKPDHPRVMEKRKLEESIEKSQPSRLPVKKNNYLKGRDYLKGTNSVVLEEYFEGGTFPPTDWTVVDNAGTGLVWDFAAVHGDGNYCSTGEAATCNSDAAGTMEYDTELRTPEINAAGMTDVTLSYIVNYQNYAGGDFFDLDISTNGGSNWTTIISWNEDHGAFKSTPGETVAVNLDSYLTGASTMIIRWHYYDPDTGDWQWYAQIDDVVLESAGAGWLSVAPNNGTVAPGDSAKVGVTFDATGLFGGDYFADVVVASNDPVNPQVSAGAHLHVTGAADISVNPDLVDFGTLFIDQSDTNSFSIINTGTDTLHLYNMTNPTLSEFTLQTGLVPYLLIGDSLVVDMEFTSGAVGVFADTVWITSNATSGDAFVALTAEAIAPPVIVMSDTLLQHTMRAGEEDSTSLTMYNQGASDLEYTLALGEDPFSKAMLRLISQTQDPSTSFTKSSEVSPTISSNISSGLGFKAPWDLQFNIDIDAIGTGIAGCEFDGTYFYVAEWGYTGLKMIYKLDINGVLVSSFDSPTTGTGIRDMAYDGTNLFGSNASTTVYEFTGDGVLVGTFNSPVNVRTIAYDPRFDGFWVSDWDTDIVLIDRSGNTLSSIPVATHELGGMYGCAYDDVSPNGPYLWVFDQGLGQNNPQYIHQMDLNTGMLTGVTHDVMNELVSTDAIAGGLFITTDYVSGKVTIGGVLQGAPTLLFGYELTDHNVWVSIGHTEGTIVPGDSGIVWVYWHGVETEAIHEGYLGVFSNDPVNPVENVHLILDVTITGIDDLTEALPTKYALHQNFPNPFNPSTTIKYDLKAKTDVKLTIYNVLGQKIRTLVNKSQVAGYQKIVWDGLNEFGEKVSTGVYVYRIEAGDFAKSRKMVFMK